MAYESYLNKAIFKSSKIFKEGKMKLQSNILGEYT